MNALYVDVHTAIRQYEYLSQMVPSAEMQSINVNGWADYWWQGVNGTVQVEEKHWSEVLGSLDHIEDQLAKEFPHADQCHLVIRGTLTSWDDNCSMTWNRNGLWMRPLGKGIRGEARQAEPYRQNYRGLMMKLAKFQDFGIHVHQVDGWESVCQLVASLYEDSQHPEESKTFQRLIKPKPVLTMGVEDERVRKLALQIMGITAGVGEEIALSLAETYKSRGLASLMLDLSGDGWDKAIATIPLRGGKRTIGPAAVKNLKSAFGIKEPVSA